MANPGVGGTLSAATDTLIGTPTADDLLIVEGGLWKNKPIAGKIAMATKGGQETVSSQTLTTNTTLDLAQGNIFDITVGANLQLSFTGAVAGKGCSFTLYLKQNATGNYTVTWGNTIRWSGGAPTLTKTANAIDILVFESIDGGGTWFGSLVGVNFV